MGPPDQVPEFPIYDTLVWPEKNKLVPYKLDMPCNWLQVARECRGSGSHGVFAFDCNRRAIHALFRCAALA